MHCDPGTLLLSVLSFLHGKNTSMQNPVLAMQTQSTARYKHFGCDFGNQSTSLLHLILSYISVISKNEDCITWLSYSSSKSVQPEPERPRSLAEDTALPHPVVLLPPSDASPAPPSGAATPEALQTTGATSCTAPPGPQGWEQPGTSQRGSPNFLSFTDK